MNAEGSDDRERLPPGHLGIAPVAVAIATCNRPHFLRQALRSCREQSLRPESVIVVDDGSDEETAAVVRSFKSLNVVFVSVGKIGLGNARNLATSICRSKYICILDDDDIMLPDRIRDHIRSLADGAQMSHGGWINFNGRGELQYKPGKSVTEDVILHVGNAIHHDACCYETSVLREFPYRTDIWGGIDFDLAVRVVRSGIRCCHTGSYVLLRRRHPASISVQHRDGQANLRKAIVGASLFKRPVSEVTAGIQAARRVGESRIRECVPASQLYRMIGGVARAVRVVAAISRTADLFFDLVVRLRLSWTSIDIVDLAASPGATFALVSRATLDVGEIDRFDSALQRNAIRPLIVAADHHMFRAQSPRMKFDSAGKSFRLGLRSTTLRELYLAHLIIRAHRAGRWYVVARRRRIKGRTESVYFLVSAEFQKAASDREHAESSDLRKFIVEQTHMEPFIIDEGASL